MSDGLFSQSLISAAVQKSLPAGFVIRSLAPSDYEKGFLTALSQLTTVGTISKAQFIDRYNYLKKHNYEYFTIVIEEVGKKKIAAAGTIFVERKFIHENSLVGHIEDIVTLTDYRGLNLGKAIIECLKHIGKNAGCYKIILDCSEKNIPFYNKCGFVQKEYEMAWYVDENDSTKKSKL
ncbi:hypothetical protein SmJEL517_g01400 [Synchytrium microbalum]|uniref:Glucosamine 6-phosphate N-acetyltransferase n=1 Tax=Synchytrium microbalum TaxID=1806994 RepID=A0A507C523_9FUNG|nr:uncharacterized protein SmJEL517_g01400 [Synchytrium microbalum]TPX36650.1 hypothetical protein SmJEL517_g01400 [Synchytrium microbalum]